MSYWKVTNLEDLKNISSISISRIAENHFILRYEYTWGGKGDYVSKTLRGAKTIASREFKRDKKLEFEYIG